MDGLLTHEDRALLTDLGLSAAGYGLFVEARALFRAVLCEAPEHDAALCGLAMVELGSGNLKAAQEVLARTVSSASSLLLKGLVQHRSGNARAARQFFEAAFLADPSSPASSVAEAALSELALERA